MLDLSRFDVGGVTESAGSEGLSAYLFSERGLYRPGDEIHVGALVRSHNLSQKLVGLPLELVVSDPRGMEVKRQRFKLGTAGLEEFSYPATRWFPSASAARSAP